MLIGDVGSSMFFFFFKQKTAYEMLRSLVGSEMCIRDRYERFHDHLGRLDANQPRTRLFDAITEAADMLDQYVHEIGRPNAKKRIFALTDGADNASSRSAWEVAAAMQARGIVVDCIPLVADCLPLRAICAASGGVCFDVVDEAQGSRLFESEATVVLAAREEAPRPATITSACAFEQLSTATQQAAPVQELRVKPSAAVFAPVMSSSEAEKQCSNLSGKTSPNLRRAVSYTHLTLPTKRIV
eukprot:TRINITY_DN38987_c0_g1_i1.p1 TRINITY_DN38987_c0_g1~~TRINITY_DN38987_c0_g1_i1.p1  ORF type:complete len:242 (-),score=66.23 TRINITY_DN38987_c0_g1_i1:97-822(-)